VKVSLIDKINKPCMSLRDKFNSDIEAQSLINYILFQDSLNRLVTLLVVMNLQMKRKKIHSSETILIKLKIGMKRVRGISRKRKV
jgi:hypothetical protein